MDLRRSCHLQPIELKKTRLKYLERCISAVWKEYHGSLGKQRVQHGAHRRLPTSHDDDDHRRRDVVADVTEAELSASVERGAVRGVVSAHGFANDMFPVTSEKQLFRESEGGVE